MELYLKNIGKIKESTVKLNGITVIAGENNTGKSTVGKALFSVFNSFYKIDEKVKSEKTKLIENKVFATLQQESVDPRIDEDFGIIYFDDEISEAIFSKLVENKVDWLNNQYDEKLLLNIIRDTVNKYYEPSDFKTDLIEELYGNFENIKSITREKFLNLILEKQLSQEFSGQICNIDKDDKAEIRLTIKDKNIKVRLQDNKVEIVTDEINLNTEVVYVDNPFIIDELQQYSLQNSRFFRKEVKNHKEHLLGKLKIESQSANEILVSEKINSTLYKLNKACEGMAINLSGKIGYKRESNKKLLDIRNISTGMKTFMILKTLLLNGTISDKGTIILDEPEIHLHPEWQLLFAEIIVLLQKEFGLHVLLTTHSPYFLNAIEVYSEKYGVKENCEYYLAENIEEYAEIKNVTKNLEPIYSKLARPMQILEVERYQEDE